MKKLFIFFSFLVGFFLLINLSKDLLALVRSNLIDIETVNISFINISEEVKGKVIFLAEPVKTQSSGNVKYLLQDYTFVEEGQPVAVINDKDTETEIFAQKRGIFVRSTFNSYYSDIQNVLSSDPGDFIVHSLDDGQRTESGDSIGSLITYKEYVIALQKTPSFQNPRKIAFCIGKNSETVDSDVLKETEDYYFTKLDYYFTEFFNRNSFRVVTREIYGFEVNNSELVSKNGSKGVLIVNGNKVYFLPLILYYSGDKVYAEINDEYFRGYKSFLLVKTPRLLRENEVIGGF